MGTRKQNVKKGGITALLLFNPTKSKTLKREEAKEPPSALKVWINLLNVSRKKPFCRCSAKPDRTKGQLEVVSANELYAKASKRLLPSLDPLQHHTC